MNGSRSVGNATAQYNAIGDHNHLDFITFISDARKRCDRSERVENCGDASRGGSSESKQCLECLK